MIGQVAEGVKPVSLLYYKCDWLVRFVSGAVFHQIIDKAQKLGGNFYWLDSIPNNNLVIMQFVLAVPSEKMLIDFVQQAGKSIGLDNWIQFEENRNPSDYLDAMWHNDLANLDLQLSLVREIRELTGDPPVNQ